MLRTLFAALTVISMLGLAGCSRGAPGTDATAGNPSQASADTLVATGIEQLSSGDSAAAQTTFENALDLDPANAYALYNLGLIAQGAGRDAQAEERYNAALEADPGFASALYNLGILRETEDLEASIDLYRRAIAADPELAPAHMRLGFALLHLGKTAEAQVELARGIELDPALKDVRAPTYG